MNRLAVPGVCRRIACTLLAAIAVVAAFMMRPLSAASDTVVISEFRTRGPLGGNDEFIELYNVSLTPQTIGGFQILGSSNTAPTGVRVTIPPGTTIGAGCHYLIVNTAANGYSGAVPGNLTYTTGISDNGGIALATGAGTIIDQVGVTTTVTAYREGTPLGVLLSTNIDRSYERKSGGASGNATDTDDNAADFTLVTPANPQNLASSCIGTSSPPVGAGQAQPAIVEPGLPLLLTVAVTSGTNPTSASLVVTADLSQAHGSPAQQLFDDGGNGDAVAGDLVFSFGLVAPMEPRTYTVPFTVQDNLARSTSGTFSFAVRAAALSLAIHDIQGSGSFSPYTGRLVATSGIVTATKSNGFFLQAPESQIDADSNTSEGVFVFTSSPPSTVPGHYVTVTGTVQEFQPDVTAGSVTEIAGPTVTLVGDRFPLPGPVALTMADTSPLGGREQLERYEGMRVLVPSLTVTAPTGGVVNEANATATSNGVFYGVVTGIPRPLREAGIEVGDPLPAGAPPNIPRFDGNPERIRIDSDALAGAAPIDVTTGAVVTNLVGPLDYAFGVYAIYPDPAQPPAVTGNHKAIPVRPGLATELTIASFNMQRFFDTVDDPAISDVALTAPALQNRLVKASLAIRNIMRTPDVIGVEEMENLPLLQALARQVSVDAVAAGEADPEYQGILAEGNDIGGIDVGFLVRSSRVAIDDWLQFGKDTVYVQPNGTTAVLNDRPPLLVHATPNLPGVAPFPITIIVNHLRSLSGIDDPSDGDRVRAKRLAQAQYLARYVQDLQSSNPHERVVLVGDFNAFEVNDGYVDVMGIVKGTPAPSDQVVLSGAALVDPDLTDLVETKPRDERYSFVFDGTAQELDHVLVTRNLLPFVSDFLSARNNADFPEVMRGDPSRAERISDHDMVVAYLRPPLATTLEYVGDRMVGIGSDLHVAGVLRADDVVLPEKPLTFRLANGQSTSGIGAGTIPNVIAAPGPVTLTVSFAGNARYAATSVSTTVNVFDASPPTIDHIAASVSEIWPPNKRMVPVALDVAASDAIDPDPLCRIVAVWSNEPSIRDWQVTGTLTVLLRADRDGKGSGRVYTIDVSCTDASGNESIGSATVIVPHDR